MLIARIMSTDVRCIEPDTTLFDAARLMRDLDVGSLPICEDDRLVGIVTDRDLAVRGMAEDCVPHETPVRDIMTAGLVFAYDDQDVDSAARLMEEYQVRRLPVLDHDRRLVGIVSLGDLAAECREPSLSARTLRGVSQRSGMTAAPDSRSNRN